MNNNVLISTAMLNAYWEKEKRDTLELLVPFVKYSIAQTTAQGSEIDVSTMIGHFRKEFGYESIPTNVITLILNRLSPAILKRYKGKYILKVSLDEDVQKFEKGHTQFLERRSKVAQALKAFLNENLTLCDQYDEEIAMQALITFFATNGLCVIRDTMLLEMLKKSDDALKYCIAQFILQEWNAKSYIFNYIEDMVKGFFVSTVISLQPQNITVAHSKFKGLQCYIDTRIIINALGLHLPEAKEASLELLQMLKAKGAELCCFEHNYREIEDIVAAYKNGLKNPRNNRSHQTLEGWDEQKYTVTDVERYQILLASKITALGIKVIPRPSISDLQAYPFNDNDLVSYIEERMNYGNRDALETDVSSVASILLLREGHRALEIEKSKAIFITSNIKLVSVVNSFLEENNVCFPENEAMPIITDMDMSSIVWLKCYSTHKDYPKQRLIEHALVALEPSPALLTTFFDIVDRIESEGGITEDEAAIIRTDAFCRKELANTVKGDNSSITEQTVYDIKDKLRKKYVGAAEEKTDLNYKKYIEERETNRNSIVKALENVKTIRQTAYNKIYELLNVIAWIIIVGLIFSFIILSVIGVKDNGQIWRAMILLFFSICGTVDMVASKMNHIKRLIKYIATAISDRLADKKKAEYVEILGIDSDYISE